MRTRIEEFEILSPAEQLTQLEAEQHGVKQATSLIADIIDAFFMIAIGIGKEDAVFKVTSILFWIATPFLWIAATLNFVKKIVNWHAERKKAQDLNLKKYIFDISITSLFYGLLTTAVVGMMIKVIAKAVEILGVGMGPFFFFSAMLVAFAVNIWLFGKSIYDYLARDGSIDDFADLSQLKAKILDHGLAVIKFALIGAAVFFTLVQPHIVAGGIASGLAIAAGAYAIVMAVYHVYQTINNWDKIKPLLGRIKERLGKAALRLWETCKNFFSPNPGNSALTSTTSSAPPIKNYDGSTSNTLGALGKANAGSQPEVELFLPSGASLSEPVPFPVASSAATGPVQSNAASADAHTLFTTSPFPTFKSFLSPAKMSEVNFDQVKDNEEEVLLRENLNLLDDIMGCLVTAPISATTSKFIIADLNRSKAALVNVRSQPGELLSVSTTVLSLLKTKVASAVDWRGADQKPREALAKLLNVTAADEAHATANLAASTGRSSPSFSHTGTDC